MKVSAVRRPKRRGSYEHQDTIKVVRRAKNCRLKVHRWGNYNDHNGCEQQPSDAVFQFAHFADSGRLIWPTHPKLQQV